MNHLKEIVLYLKIKVTKNISTLLIASILTVPLFMYQLEIHTQLFRPAKKLSPDTIAKSVAMAVLLFLIVCLWGIWMNTVVDKLGAEHYLRLIMLFIIPIMNMLVLSNNLMLKYIITIAFTIIFVCIALSYLRLFIKLLINWIKPDSDVNYQRLNAMIAIGGMLVGAIAAKL